MKKYRNEDSEETSNLADMIAIVIAIVLAIILVFIITPMIARSHPKIEVAGAPAVSEVYYDYNNE